MRKRTWILLGLLVVAVAVGIALVYFNASSPGEKNATVAWTQRPEVALPPPPGVGGLVGRFWGIDDTGLGNYPLDEGSFLVVPGVTVEELWPNEALGRTGLQLARFSADYDLDQLAEQYGATIAEVQPDGQFRVIAPPGPAVMCLIDLGMVGCSELDLPESGTVQAHFSIGGFSSYVE